MKMRVGSLGSFPVVPQDGPCSLRRFHRREKTAENAPAAVAREKHQEWPPKQISAPPRGAEKDPPIGDSAYPHKNQHTTKQIDQI
jgi:hypothetical protein